MILFKVFHLNSSRLYHESFMGLFGIELLKLLKKLLYEKFMRYKNTLNTSEKPQCFGLSKSNKILIRTHVSDIYSSKIARKPCFCLYQSSLILYSRSLERKMKVYISERSVFRGIIVLPTTRPRLNLNYLGHLSKLSKYYAYLLTLFESWNCCIYLVQ